MSNPASYYRARMEAIKLALSYELSLPESREQAMRIAYLRNGHVPDKFYTGPRYQFRTSDGNLHSIDSFIGKTQNGLSNQPLTELELHTYDTWFQLHPEKVGGTQQGGSGYSFPVRTIGSKNDITNAIDATLKQAPLQRGDAGKRRGQGDENKPQTPPSSHTEFTEVQKPKKTNLSLYKYKAKAIALKMKMQTEQKELGKVIKNEEGIFTEIDVTLKKEIIPELKGENAKILTSKDGFNYIKTAFKYLNYKEEFIVLLLNRGNKVIGWHNASKGSATATIADAAQIMGLAVKTNAQGVIVAHNHPSGIAKPSQADKEFTKELKTSLAQLKIALLDSMIVTQDNDTLSINYYSFADNGDL